MKLEKIGCWNHQVIRFLFQCDRKQRREFSEELFFVNQKAPRNAGRLYIILFIFSVYPRNFFTAFTTDFD